MYDLVIRNGRMVDGLGSEARRADVAVKDGRIVEVGEVAGQAQRTIDAAGLVVAPGFIDPHTHYDAQLCWDPLVTPSSWHGVTSVVTGNCGVGIAPCRPADREIVTQDLVTVEQIPYAVLNEGIRWDWTGFDEYMGASERRGCALNTGFIAPLTPFRHFVMGEAAIERAATPEEARAIKAMLQAAVAAGALGFSTTTLLNHVGYKGLPLACRQADRAELAAYCQGLKELGKGCVEIAVTNTGTVGEPELDLLELVTSESGRPVTWLALLERDDMPDMCQETLRLTERFAGLGAKAQVSCRPLSLNIDLADPALLARDIPAFRDTAGKPVEALTSLYRDPGFRAAFREDMRTPRTFSGRWDLMTVHEARTPAMQAYVGRLVSDIAAERGCDGLDAFLDLAIEDGLALVYNYEAFNTAEDRVARLISDPRTLIGISDAGAHVDMLCDAGYATYLLGHWVRERQALTLEHAVRRLTSDPANMFGLKDRGRIAVGAAADIVIFDEATIGSPRSPTELRADLPNGGKRMITPAFGVQATIVNGVVVLEAGRHTGDLPGQVLRPH